MGLCLSSLQENDESFLTKNMKAMLDNKADIRKDGQAEPSRVLERLIGEVQGTRAEWCRQQGIMDSDVSKQRLQHSIAVKRCTYSELEDAVLHG